MRGVSNFGAGPFPPPPRPDPSLPRLGELEVDVGRRDAPAHDARLAAELGEAGTVDAARRSRARARVARGAAGAVGGKREKGGLHAGGGEGERGREAGGGCGASAAEGPNERGGPPCSQERVKRFVAQEQPHADARAWS